jgi:hypothetical protein
MIPAGTTGRTRATALASQAARVSRWPAGTLAAAGTIPARTMSTHATLVISQGHHPANIRSAIPARVYESGSGHGHDAAPAGHPHPPRAPPSQPRSRTRAPVPWPAHHRLPAARVKAACGAAPAGAPRTLTRVTARTNPWQPSGHGIRQPRPPSPPARTPQPCKPLRTRRASCKALTSRFI